MPKIPLSSARLLLTTARMIYRAMVNTANRSRSLCSAVPGMLPGLLCIGLLIAATPAVSQGLEAPSRGDAAFERCRAISDDAERLRCFEEATSPSPASRPGQQDGVADNWRLVRTPNPAGGPDMVSIMRTADPSRSDLDFAGLMLRCGDKTTEVLLVMLQPFPPHAHPRVTIAAGTTTAEFSAITVPPGVLLLLPPEAMALTAGAWRTAPVLAITVKDERGLIRGVVPLTGLESALQVLQSNCATR